MAMSDAAKKTYASIDAYIAGCAPEIQPLLREMCRVIREEAPEAAEKISWGMPTFVLHGNLVHFAAGKHHLGLYPAPSAVTEFQAELTEYKTSKGAIQFPYAKPVPWELVRRIVRFRTAENTALAKEKKKVK